MKMGTMGNIHRVAGVILAAVAVSLMIQRPAAGEQPATTAPPTGMVAIPEPVPDNASRSGESPDSNGGSNGDCRSCRMANRMGLASAPAGPSPYLCCPPQVPPDCQQCPTPQVGLAVPTEYWPPPCGDCNQCDPLQSCCPNRDEFFLVPPRNCWYGIADGVAIRRDPRQNFEFTTLGPVAEPITFSTGDFQYDFAAGGHFVVGHTFGECLQVEGVYTGLREVQNLAALPAGDSFAQLRYASSLQSAEVYLRRKMPMPPERLAVSILCGARYLGIPEELDFNPSAAAPLHSSVGTDNQLVGPEIGAMFEFSSDNRWWVNFEMKAALLNNHASYSYTAADTSTFIHREDHTSFLGDLALTFVYRWSPHFATRLGYQAYFLSGLALAPDNANPDLGILAQIPAELHHDSNQIYHGPLAGIEFGW